jgi:ADP-ribosylglycohydrolase
MDRIKGLIYGSALGDCIGAYTEFRTRQTLQYISEEEFTFPLNDIPMERRDPSRLWTDDTCQMITAIDTLLEGRGDFDVETFARRLRYWVENGFSEIGQRRGDGCGGITFRIVMDVNFLSDPIGTSRSIMTGGKSLNGSIMRCAIIGCLPKAKNAVMKDAIQLSKATHCESRCVISCCIITSIVYDILNGVDEEKIIPRAMKYNYPDNKYYQDIDDFCDVEYLDDLDLDDTTMGYSLKCLAVGIWAFRNRHRPYKKIITEIALQGGCSDSNGCVAGAILGCYKGFSCLPDEWLEEMREKDFLYGKFDEFTTLVKRMEAERLHSSLLSFEQ